MRMPNYRFNLKWAVCVIAIAGGLVVSPVLAQGKGGGKPGGGGSNTSGPSYTVIKLDDGNGTLPLSSYQGITDLNDLGQVVGTVQSDGHYVAAFWEVSINGSELTLLKGLYSIANGCNNLGEVVGSSYGLLGGAYWPSRLDEPISLDVSGYSSILNDINDAGVVCGNSKSDSSAPRIATLWNVRTQGSKLSLPSVAGYPHSNATKISEVDASGRFFVLGYVGLLVNGSDLEVRWDVQQDLSGNLTASEPYVLENASPGPVGVVGMNDSGETCGSLFDDTLLYKNKDWLPVGYVPMYWSASGTPIALERLPSTVLSPNIEKAAFDINNSGVLVGECYARHDSKKIRSGIFATVWSSAQASPYKLESASTSSPFDFLYSATAINESGLIAGYGIINSETRGFVAIPNP